MRSLWKKMFFVHMSKNFTISGKLTLYPDHFEKVVFGPYLRKYQNSIKRCFSLDWKKSNKDNILWSHVKNHFYSKMCFSLITFNNHHNLHNINYTRKKTVFCDHMWKFNFIRKTFFAHNSLKINFTRKTTMFCGHMLKIICRS